MPSVYIKHSYLYFFITVIVFPFVAFAQVPHIESILENNPYIHTSGNDIFINGGVLNYNCVTAPSVGIRVRNNTSSSKTLYLITSGSNAQWGLYYLSCGTDTETDHVIIAANSYSDFYFDIFPYDRDGYPEGSHSFNVQLWEDKTLLPDTLLETVSLTVKIDICPPFSEITSPPDNSVVGGFFLSVGQQMTALKMHLVSPSIYWNGGHLVTTGLSYMKD